MRIAIVGGGGAGLTATWLLEQEHDVTLFEQEPRLGGHAHTVAVELAGRTCHHDAGFEFLSEGMFPTFVRLLRLVDAPLRPYRCTATFHTADGSMVRVLPPKRDGRVVLSGFAPRSLADMVQFAYVLRASRGLMQRKDDTIPLERFVERLPGLTRRFKDQFLYPFLLAQWCVEPHELLGFMAYDVLRYSYEHFGLSLDAPSMLDIEGGTRSYVDAVRSQFTRATVRLGAGVKQIERTEGGLDVLSEGRRERFDAVVLATNAAAASRLLQGIAGQEEASRQFGRVRYFKTTIAIHGDTRLMPKNRAHWSIVNTRYDGVHSQNTVWKPWHTPEGHPLFKSWVTYEQRLPEPLYAAVEFDHPKIDADYFQSQKALEPLQGRHGIWFCGMQTYDVDCHESVVLSAARVARHLSPRSERLRRLMS